MRKKIEQYLFSTRDVVSSSTYHTLVMREHAEGRKYEADK